MLEKLFVMWNVFCVGISLYLNGLCDFGGICCFVGGWDLMWGVGRSGGGWLLLFWEQAGRIYAVEHAKQPCIFPNWDNKEKVRRVGDIFCGQGKRIVYMRVARQQKCAML